MNQNIQEKYNFFSKWLLSFTYNKPDLVKIIFINILINWSILIEDLPWVWKTTLSKAISKLLWFDFNRIQWTSDLIPQDIIGWEFFNFSKKEIEVRKWPIFTQLLLIDEINRMPPKTQSAFLQAMEEKQISILGNEYKLDKHFFVIATQNPIENSWTFPLPEAQKDRFTSRISLWIPNNKLQLDLIINNKLNSLSSKLENLSPLINKEDLDKYFIDINNVIINKEVWVRFVKFFNEIKISNDIMYPLSQRWISIFILWCKANAYINWRDYVQPEDWEELLDSFLAYRLDINDSNNGILKELYNTSFKNF